MTRPSPAHGPLPETITPETLRLWMESGAPVAVLDVRPQKEREDWSIPGSLHVDAYRALRSDDPHALDAAILPPGLPVVTVCAAGRTSLLAAALLRSRGISACSLEGGMKAWSGAWNLADVPAPGPGLRIIQVRRTGKGCISYIVGIEGRAAVIDASVDHQVYLDIARRNGWRICAVVETHVHADHLSRSRALSGAAGAGHYIPHQDRVTHPHVSVRDGDVIPLGAGVGLKALRTPGHTDESTCYHLGAGALFTGDTLFLKGVGRPDLEGGRAEALTRARELYRSLARVRALPRETLILPSHTPTPVAFDGVPLCASLDQVTRENPLSAEDEDTFASTITERIPPAPPNFARIMRSNETGEPPAEDPLELEGGSNRCAVA